MAAAGDAMTKGAPTHPGVYWVRAKGRKRLCVVELRRWRRKLVIVESFTHGGPLFVDGIAEHERIEPPRSFRG